MPDITMCNSTECPSRGKCYRHEATPNEWQIISGTIEDGVLTVTDLDLEGDGSGTFMGWIFEPALKQSTGELHAVCIWERGDAINRLLVQNGTVEWFDIEI